MAYNLHIVRPSDFVRLDPYGRCHLEESRVALTTLAKQCVERGINCALLDVREMQAGLSLGDIYLLANAFREMGFRTDHRLAILHRYGGTGQAEFFALAAADKGWNVRAFEEYEEAIDWFGAEWDAER